VLPAIFALLALLACAVPAGAATGFVADETLSPDQAGAPVVAMAPNGFAAVAWIETAVGPRIGVRVAVRAPGGTWSVSQPLGANGFAKTAVDLAVDANGNAAVTWQEPDPLPSVHVFVATRPAGGAFGTAEALPLGTTSPSVGIDGGGRATLLYGTGSDVAVRDVQAGASALAARPQTLAPGCEAVAGMLDVAPSGAAIAAWDCRGAVFALRRGGAWTASPTIANSSNCPSDPITVTHFPGSVDIDVQGNAVGLLSTSRTTCPPIFAITGVELRLVTVVGGRLQPVSPPVATAPGGFASGIYLARAIVAPSGILFTWGDGTLSLTGAGMARFFALDGTPTGPAQPLGNGENGTTPPVAADGRALATWVQREGDSTSVVAAERAPGAPGFGPPVPVSGVATVADQAVAMDDAGNGLIAWRHGSRPSLVHVRGYDGASPALGAVTIPGSAPLGAQVAFAASPQDVWSAVVTVWSFGDGGTAAGATTAHAYARDGTYTATVTAVDALGNAVSRSGVVQVGSGAGAGGDQTSGAPRLTNVSLTHRRFRVGRARTPLRGTAQAAARRRASAVPVGTTFRFTLNRAANVRIGFARQTRGLRNGDGDCVRPSRRLTRGRRCRLFVPDGTLVRSAPSGAIRIPFSGRVGRRALRPGRYRAGLTAAIGGQSAKPTVLTFRVVR